MSTTHSILSFLFKAIFSMMIIVFLAGVGAVLYNIGKSRYWQHQKGLVVINVKYDEEACSKERPLRYTATNGSNYSVDKITWNLGVFNSGFSTNLLTYKKKIFSHDKILLADESWTYCFPPPMLGGSIRVNSFEDTQELSRVEKTLRYTLQNKQVTFTNHP